MNMRVVESLGHCNIIPLPRAMSTLLPGSMSNFVGERITATRG